ncbi:MAG: hypothetical protein KDC07_07430 [Chitinophagaceae bacterium]|nr:hypothetical protein [Chitinophagaceae bacterium]MCB9045502.1 hypothetical protein [Chitinophagales bacterium]
MNTPFSLSEATDIAEDFSDLVETGLVVESGAETMVCTIQNIVIAPFQPEERASFVQAMMAGGELSTILRDYQGTDFEVLIIARENTNIANITLLPIRDYTRIYDIPYRYPGTY